MTTFHKHTQKNFNQNRSLWCVIARPLDDKVCLRNGRRALFRRQGHHNLIYRKNASNQRLQGHSDKDRPLRQRRRRHNEPLHPRRGLRNRRRRRNRPRPRRIREISKPQPAQSEQHHNRTDISDGYQQRTSRRLPRKVRPNCSPHHERN